MRRLALAIAVLLAAWVAACLVVFTWSPWQVDAPAPADAVVVLAGGLNSRLDPALALMRRRVAPVLAISGAFHGTRWKTARKLCTGGYGRLRYRVLCFEPKPFSTQGEARALDRLARQHRWTRLVVVTSTFHVTRARLLIRRCYDGGLSMVGTHTPWWRLPGDWVSETGKLFVQLTYQRGC
jgi:uncharacterized SAM-binding protein YcdF (DUF218 family)